MQCSFPAQHMAFMALFLGICVICSAALARAEEGAGAAVTGVPGQPPLSLEERQQAIISCSAKEARNTSFNYDSGKNARRKFLTLDYLGEQLSKARIHLAQLYVLAQLTKRTVILPSVSDSRIGYWSPPPLLPFCAYFDMADRHLGEWVTEDYFREVVVGQAWNLSEKGFAGVLMESPSQNCAGPSPL
eukprot:TRINITY_DN3036_c0_g1_i1.p1 TRINITY_DN3036_c0_g1~~TRINITY_DN3036_c0_g1_i1.p1  ORF type:complete len:188 (+),score=21.59 TRINITY_DN3036_c0_g1_i1:96-659(+)